MSQPRRGGAMRTRNLYVQGLDGCGEWLVGHQVMQIGGDILDLTCEWAFGVWRER
jgi:hypothetical protein